MFASCLTHVNQWSVFLHRRWLKKRAGTAKEASTPFLHRALANKMRLGDHFCPVQVEELGDESVDIMG